MTVLFISFKVAFAYCAEGFYVHNLNYFNFKTAEVSMLKAVKEDFFLFYLYFDSIFSTETTAA